MSTSKQDDVDIRAPARACVVACGVVVESVVLRNLSTHLLARIRLVVTCDGRFALHPSDRSGSHSTSSIHGFATSSAAGIIRVCVTAFNGSACWVDLQ